VAPSTEVVAGDVREPASLEAALKNVDVAYYLVHSMEAGSRFVQQDEQAAKAFAAAAVRCGVGRIVYLGGLGHGEGLSPHLASRQQVGRIFRDTGVPTVEFRSSIVIGSGSLSFEIMRALVERLPVMVTPRWAQVRTQPVWIGDAVSYLVGALDWEEPGSRVFEIGGPDRLPYRELMREYARQRGLRRLIFPVPVLTPHLSSLWLGLVTPVYTRVGRELIEGLRNETVVRDTSALEAFPIRPTGVREAIRATLRHEDEEIAKTRFSEAFASEPDSAPWGGRRFRSRVVDSRTVGVPVPPSVAFAPIRRIGGANGWYYGNALWQLRGTLDRLVGGIGMRRGRRDPDRLQVGDRVDCWRVEAVEPDQLLRLVAEMRLPGRAWLQFEVDGDSTGSTIRQSSIFDPAGVWGRIYWHALYPAHHWIFQGMLQAIAARLIREESAST
jgi:uncharacterized protein YbjT (DUF2867 family)